MVRILIVIILVLAILLTLRLAGVFSLSIPPMTLNTGNQDTQATSTVNKPNDNNTKQSVDVATSPAKKEKIVFWSLRDAQWMWNWSMNWNQLTDNNYEIYIMDTDGKNQVRLTNNSDVDLMPSISPDGKKILFVSDRKCEPDNKFDNNYDIYVMDVDGSNTKNLTGHKAIDTMPCWSPDGTMIAFCSKHATWWDLYVMDAEGKYFLHLYPNRNQRDWNFPVWPSWSPDGTKILFSTGQSGRYDINLIEIDYDLVRQIVLNPNYNNFSGEAWSVTGTRRVVRQVPNASNTTNNPNSDLVLKSVRQLNTLYASYSGKASFSPDGTRIAFEGDRKIMNTHFYDIYVINADGSNLVNLTNPQGTEGQGQYNDWPAWSPDGTKIAFVSDREGKPMDFGLEKKNAWQIYTMDADGNNVTKLTNNNFTDGSPNWGSVPAELAAKLQTPPTPLLTFSPEAVISPLDLVEIRKYIGREVAVEGVVVDYMGAWDAETRPILLFFDNPKQHCVTYDEWNKGQCGTDFRVVIPIQDLKKLPDIYSYLNKKIRVLGRIEYYKGAPCVIVYDPQQIVIIK